MSNQRIINNKIIFLYEFHENVNLYSELNFYATNIMEMLCIFAFEIKWLFNDNFGVNQRKCLQFWRWVVEVAVR